MTKKVNKHFLHDKPTTKSMKICAMKSEELTRPFNISAQIRPLNDSMQSSCQGQTGNKTYCQSDQRQASATKHSRTKIAIGANKISLSQKCMIEKTTERTNKVQIPASRSQSQGLLTNTSSATVQQTQSPCVLKSASALTGDAPVPGAKEDQTADRQVKQKKSAKKKQDGTSNWMKLCTTLNIDGTKRKTKPLKRAASNNGLEQGEHSQVKRTKPGIWFDNVDKILIEPEPSEHSEVDKGGSSAGKDTAEQLVKPDSFKGVTNCVAMDCEMVGVGPTGEESILARVSIVNHFGVCLYDKYVQPREKVTDYRTYVSGVTAEHLAIGEEFTKVQSEVSDLIKDRILVGHAVHNDLKVLLLTHPHKMIRDTSLYKPFRELFNGRLPSLKKLTDKVLGVQVQEGQHSSVQDAQATMRLYTMHRQKWEKQLRQDRKMGRSRQRQKTQAKPDSV